jgi:hypothetical protein
VRGLTLIPQAASAAAQVVEEVLAESTFSTFSRSFLRVITAVAVAMMLLLFMVCPLFVLEEVVFFAGYMLSDVLGPFDQSGCDVCHSVVVFGGQNV